MSHFYGRLQGNRGEATRCGAKSSGIQASVQSWHGSLIVRLDERDEGTWAAIYYGVGSTGYGDRILWEGPLADLTSARRLLAVQPEYAEPIIFDAEPSKPQGDGWAFYIGEQLQPVSEGQVISTDDGETFIYQGISQPPSPGKSGKVSVRPTKGKRNGPLSERIFYPHVFDGGEIR